jgi:ATP-binding cassette subfamily F protein uup
VGGYSDWYRTSAKPGDKSSKSKQVKTNRDSGIVPQVPVPPGPRRRTWKEGQELESLPVRIEELENRQVKLHAMMSDPAFYQGDGKRVADAKAELEAVAADLARSYARWEELENLER